MKVKLEDLVRVKAENNNLKAEIEKFQASVFEQIEELKSKILEVDSGIVQLKQERQDLQEHMKAQKKIGKGGKGGSIVYTIATDKKQKHF